MVERVVVGPMHTNSYIYSEWKKECVLVDPGAESELLLQHLTLINMKPRGIVLTHGHIDHVSAAMAVQRHYRDLGLTIKIAIHAADAKYLGENAGAAHTASFGDNEGSGFAPFDSEIDYLPEPDIIVSDGDTLFDADLRIIHTPGHTPGSVCVYSESQGLVFSGDTLMFEDVGRTDLPEGDGEVILKSIRENIFVLPEETRICPGHGPFTTVEREIRHNPYFH